MLQVPLGHVALMAWSVARLKAIVLREHQVQARRRQQAGPGRGAEAGMAPPSAGTRAAALPLAHRSAPQMLRALTQPASPSSTARLTWPRPSSSASPVQVPQPQLPSPPSPAARAAAPAAPSQAVQRRPELPVEARLWVKQLVHTVIVRGKVGEQGHGYFC